jgi:uncharacterized protein YbaP (TraB family)
MKLTSLSLFFFFLNGFTQVTKPGLLWEVTQPGFTEKSYLFGTFHSNIPHIMQLQDSTWCAFLAAKNVVFEVDIQSELVQRASYFDAAVYTQAALKRNYARSSATAYGNEDGWPQFMDMLLYDKAVLKNKNILFLETIDTQLMIMDGYDLLSVHNEDENIEMITAYSNGDIVKINKIVRENTSDSFYKRLITDRNTAMAVKLDSLLCKESLFCAVGAGHLAGKDGLIMQLRANGYKVRKVGMGDKSCATEAMLIKKYSLDLPEIKSKHTFPGKPILENDDDLSKYIYCEFGQGNIYQLEVIPLDNGILFSDLENDLKRRAVSVGKLEKIQFTATIAGLETLTQLEDGVLTWQRLIHVGNHAVLMSCHGGEKFMRSNRPKMFFDDFSIY